ncbi:glycerophosphodiester phosphodiesterase [Alcaligenaceae bacterium LF4-65]|uniref:Glycerophosphodiester phosphodiesterase n=1 Tax=Zwartia hollandica TaxID=324606 RepID=A0A953T3D7_9BURK|nr:glycerophosphodiester phosphodiesterase [Zwartia hollandica]MBZ1349266.1 glycerophosphodiester phosphodiesterase [Zwartia hollandica]
MTPSQTWQYPQLVAHRGGGSLAPENTLSALRAGTQFGYKMAEYDVKLSKDGVAILLHDAALDRTTNGKGAAGDLDFAALATLDAGSWFAPSFAGEAIPTLGAIARYTQAVGMASNIEIKPTPGLETVTGMRVAELAQTLWSGVSPPPLLSSFSLESLRAAKQAAPSLPRGWITDTLSAGWQQALAELECVSLHLKHTLVTKALIAELRNQGLRLAVWTVNDPVRANELLGWGVDAVITDAIDRIHPK